MSAAKTINDMGADVAVVDGALEVMGLDRLPPHVVERVLEMAREHKEELVQELGAKAPGPVTGLEWLPGPPDSDGPAFDTWWAAFDLADLSRLYGVRVVHAGERILAVYPMATAWTTAGFPMTPRPWLCWTSSRKRVRPSRV